MDFSALPTTAFIHPDGENRDAIASLLHRIVDQLIDTMAQAADRSPLPEPLALNVLKDWSVLPQTSQDIEKILTAAHTQMKHSMNAAHPGYIGHMDSIPTTLSIIGDLLVAALNNNMLSVEMSPVFSRLETLVLQEITQLFGLGPQANGVLVSGGSLANLQALIVARNIAFNTLENGISDQKPVFFVSEVAHTSFQKAAMIMGLGTNAAIPIATNQNSQVDIDNLKTKLAQAKTHGQTPFALVATAGTTVTGNIDPIVPMAEIAKQHQLWFHVDAAYGGAVMFSKRHRHQLAGIELANSVTFNPQKWLYVSKTCAILMFRQFDLLQHHFRVLAPYMHNHDDWPNLGELTVQGTRHPDILKLWLSSQHIGKDGYSAIIEHNYTLTHTFTQAVKARPFLTLASEPQMNLVCFRAKPAQIPTEQWDSWNHSLQQWLLTQHNSFLSLPVYRSQRWLKAVLLNPFTTKKQIERLFDAIDHYYITHGK
ncbi:MAG: aminotransferase class I/II-fold pyridoxal phosphate-dependent enzyme [Cyanobacteria bacterium P01_C01_bin.118]